MRSKLGIFILLSNQIGAQSPAFEAASVKPSDPSTNNDGISFQPGGRFNAKNLTLKGLIRMAYDVRGFQINGGPRCEACKSWIDTDRYDVETKADGNPPPSTVHLMLQTLLADRFKLKLHRETKELPVYWLVVGKSGSKLAETGDTPGPFRVGRGSLSASTTMAALANVFSNWLERVVLDKTGLAGKYNVRLEWTPDETAPPGEPEIASRPGASLFSAVEQQLGLKLVAQKGPVEILVIESAEKPSGN
jgi:uncharacterized protein (TIGR03435 family)